MKIVYQNKLLFLLVLGLLFNSCTETYILQSNTYEEALVIEATITNEFKQQEIKISKTSRLEDNGIKFEKGALVTIKDDLGVTYLFKEQDGVYLSETEFQAMPDRIYTLEINTEDGKVYQSANEKLTTENQIESITPTVTTDRDKGRGVQIKVNSYDPNNTSKYYRYEYEETYKIIAPKWNTHKLVVLPEPKKLDVILNTSDTRICYSTKKSNDIILTSTTDLNEDRVNFQVRFISDQNYIISHRYSILVKQYIQNLESYTFRKTMKEIASSASILSPKQPGFINGNIKCISNSDEKAIGFFEVSSVSSKRMFFNYSDLFPDEAIPPYFTNCDSQEFTFCFEPNDICKGNDLISLISNNRVSYLSKTYLEPIVYFMTHVECGDCTSFSSNEIPPFWIN